jgi:hypothetical protein
LDPAPYPSSLLLLLFVSGKGKKKKKKETHTLGRFELVLIWMKRRELYELIIFAGSLEIV